MREPREFRSISTISICVAESAFDRGSPSKSIAVGGDPSGKAAFSRAFVRLWAKGRIFGGS
jgi:hypothetical protein